MTDFDRERFDTLLEEVLDNLPDELLDLLEEVPLVVLDQPTPEMIAQLRAEGLEDADEDLCGLHTGIALTERSVDDHPAVPDEIHIFRRGILALAGGWTDDDQNVYEEIWITLLHEMGHHFGLDEEALAELGYE